MKSNSHKILITGAGGWLGSELTKQLLEKGNNILAINNIYTDKLKQLKKEYDTQLEVILGDICNKEFMNEQLKDIDTVFHLAAKVHVIPTNVKDEEDFFTINSKASEDIFNSCINNNIKRLIFFSTVSVYGESNDIITINSEKKPINVYGESKLRAEIAANKLYQEKQLPVTIIEPVTVYGEGDVGNFGKLEKLINKGICIRFGKGENKKTVIYYKDLINMVIKISEDDSYIGKTVICGTEVLSINKINEILIKKLNKKVIKLKIPEKMSKVIIRICKIKKLSKIRRSILALMQNNEIDYSNILKEYTKFEQYELKS